MAEQRSYQNPGEKDYAISGTAGNVFLNVYVILCIMQCIAMIITGALYFGDCPESNILNIYLIVQGVLLTIIPVVLCCVFRYGCRIKKVNYYTACVTAGILCTGWLIAGSRFLASAECKSSTVYSISLAFIVATWLFNGISCVIPLVYHCRRRYK